jgi:hypothetical protein
MGADLQLSSIFDPWLDAYWAKREAQPRDVQEALALAHNTYDDYASSGAYFRNGYNAGDVMWALGLSWHGTVKSMLDESHHLPTDKARELVAMIEARPLTRESVGKHLLAHMTNGKEEHPVMGPIHEMMVEAAVEAGVPAGPKLPPNFDELMSFLTKKREALLALLRKSIDLNEPLSCSL